MRTPARFPLALTAAALAAAAPLAAASATPVPQGPVVVAAVVASPTPDSAEGEAYAATILGRVNELRAGMGRAPLVRYVQLDAAAQAQSEQMAADGAVSHRPNFANSYPAGSSSSAEIVAVQAKADGADVAGQIVDQWMASEEDRAKMTAADANAVGIGIAYSPSTDSWYVTQSLAAYPDAAASGLTRTDGAPYVIDDASVACVKAEGMTTLTVASLSSTRDKSIIVLLNDSGGVSIEGGQSHNAVAGAPDGSATATIAGSTYTNTGSAPYVNTSTPAASGLKSYDITITCS